MVASTQRRLHLPSSASHTATLGVVTDALVPQRSDNNDGNADDNEDDEDDDEDDDDDDGVDVGTGYGVPTRSSSSFNPSHRNSNSLVSRHTSRHSSAGCEEATEEGDAMTSRYAIARVWHRGADDSGYVGFERSHPTQQACRAGHGCAAVAAVTHTVATQTEASGDLAAQTTTAATAASTVSLADCENESHASAEQKGSSSSSSSSSSRRNTKPGLIAGCIVPDAEDPRGKTKDRDDEGGGEEGGKDSRLASHPSNLCCPITYDLFCDPVIASDGFTYERSAITRWLHERRVSPLTRDPISTQLTPNMLVKKLVAEYCEAVGLPVPTESELFDTDTNMGTDTGISRRWSRPVSASSMSSLPAADFGDVPADAIPLHRFMQLLMSIQRPEGDEGMGHAGFVHHDAAAATAAAAVFGGGPSRRRVRRAQCAIS